MEAGEILGRDAEDFVQVLKLFPFGFWDEAGRTNSEGRFQRGTEGRSTYKKMRTKPMMHQVQYHMKAPNDVKALT